MTYRDRRLAKAERLREWADKREAKSDAAYKGVRQIADMIPFGQPILVGHHSEGRARRDQDRIHNGMSKTVEHSRKADEFRSRADNIESAADHAIYSDDVDAIERLKERIVDLEAEREQIKAHNKAMRKPGACDHPAECDCRTRFPRECGCKNHPLPSYALTNLSGNIKRNKDRLIVIERQQARQEQAAESESGMAIVDQGHGYVSVTFPDKPARDILDALKAAGFRWRQGSWWGNADKLPEEVRKAS